MFGPNDYNNRKKFPDAPAWQDPSDLSQYIKRDPNAPIEYNSDGSPWYGPDSGPGGMTGRIPKPGDLSQANQNQYTSRDKQNPYAGGGQYSNSLTPATTVGGPYTGPTLAHSTPIVTLPNAQQNPYPITAYDKFPGQTPPSPYDGDAATFGPQPDPLTLALLQRGSGLNTLGTPNDGASFLAQPTGTSPIASFYDPNDPNATAPPPAPEVPDPQNPQAPPGTTPSTPPGTIPGVPGGPSQNSPTTPGAGMPQLGARTTDPTVISQYVRYWASQPGSDPSMTSNPQYWIQRITGTGGIGADNAEYWQGRFRGEGGDTPGGGGGGFGGSGGQGLAMSGQFGSLWDMLMGRAGQGLAINPKDPIIANQVNAYSAQQQRQMRDYLGGLAEKEGPEANLAGETRMANEKVAQSVGAMQASLMQNELIARRQEIQQALSEMGGMLTQEQQLALQQQLGLIDRSLALSQQNFYMDWVRSTGGAP